MRTAVFHAKQGRTVFVPGNGSSARAVAAALARLARPYLALVEAHSAFAT